MEEGQLQQTEAAQPQGRCRGRGPGRGQAGASSRAELREADREFGAAARKRDAARAAAEREESAVERERRSPNTSTPTQEAARVRRPPERGRAEQPRPRSWPSPGCAKPRPSRPRGLTEQRSPRREARLEREAAPRRPKGRAAARRDQESEDHHDAHPDHSSLRLARLPVVLIDNRLSARLAETSAAGGAGPGHRHGRPARGTLLGQGHRRARRRAPGADPRSSWPRPRLEEQAAEPPPRGARDGRRTVVAKAAQKRRAAQERAACGLDEADAVEKQGKRPPPEGQRRRCGKQAAADEACSGRVSPTARPQAAHRAAAKAKQKAVQRDRRRSWRARERPSSRPPRARAEPSGSASSPRPRRGAEAGFCGDRLTCPTRGLGTCA